MAMLQWWATGVNAAPAPAEATVGVAMGAAGTDVALEAADVALLADDLEKLAYALRLAQRTRSVVTRNLVLSMLVIAVLVVGAVAGCAFVAGCGDRPRGQRVRRRRQRTADAQGTRGRTMRVTSGLVRLPTSRSPRVIRRFGLYGVVAGGLAIASVSAAAHADCGHAGVEVAYKEQADLRAACDALTDIAVYFRRIGFRVEPRFSLTFGDPDNAQSPDRRNTYGHFDARTSRVVVYRSSSIEPWGLHWNEKLAASFLRHELVHMAVWQIIGPDPDRLPREWHEFIAYAVQLDLMDRELLATVLARSASVEAFSDLLGVNEFTHGMNPDAFAVASYRTYRERSAGAFVGQLLRAEVVPPRFSYPFPVLPERTPAR
jgi:hypothetical protein